MPIFDPADSDVVLNIRRVSEDSINPSNNKVVIKAGAKASGAISVDDTVDQTDGTSVQLRINKKILGTSKEDPGYAFAQNDGATVGAICVVRSRDANAVCDPGEFPDGSAQHPGVAGWAAERTADNILLLKVPKLDSATYKYNLFLTRFDANGGSATVQIDPRIKNGGVGYMEREWLPPSFSPAGFSGNMLLLLGLLMLAAGFGLGWVLAGGRRP